MPRTIRFRLTLWYMALLALILFLFSAVLYLVLERVLYQQVDDTLVVNAQQLVGSVSSESGRVSFSSGENDPSDVDSVRARGYLVRLLDPQGRVISANTGYAVLPVSATVAAQRQLPIFETIPLNGEAYRLYTVPLVENGQQSGALQLAVGLRDVETTLRELLLILAVVIPFTLAAATLGGIFLAGRALAPIDQITRTAQRISANDLGERLNLRLPGDEVGRLARTLDQMLARLDDAFRREREFTANASHELRSPLTVMRGEIDLALERQRDADEYQRVLEQLGIQVERLTNLAHDLLWLARAETEHLAVAKQPLQTSEILGTVADVLFLPAQEKKITLEVEKTDSLLFWADEEKILRVLMNLVENALKFSPSGTRIVLSAHKLGNEIALTVTDFGPGIRADDLPYIFDRFFRGRDGHAEGTGLGLAIARALVSGQGGTLDVLSTVGQGTTFIVKMPVIRL